MCIEWSCSNGYLDLSQGLCVKVLLVDMYKLLKFHICGPSLQYVCMPSHGHMTNNMVQYVFDDVLFKFRM